MKLKRQLGALGVKQVRLEGLDFVRGTGSAETYSRELRELDVLD